jgi:hypothetical protein
MRPVSNFHVTTGGTEERLLPIQRLWDDIQIVADQDDVAAPIATSVQRPVANSKSAHAKARPSLMPSPIGATAAQRALRILIAKISESPGRIPALG